MCGRLTLKTPPAQWTQLLLPAIDFEPLASDWQPRYNIAPTQDIVVIAGTSAGAGRGGQGGQDGSCPCRFARFRWGLVPSWSNDLAIGSRMINARHETLRDKRSFVGPLRSRRCLVVADGYYEWQRSETRHKQPYWIAPADGGLLQLAGLWEVNSRATGAPVTTCTIITTAANATLSAIHDRMPVSLCGSAAQRWMDAECDMDEAYAQLGPAADDYLRPQPVSDYVNNARHEGPACLQPLAGTR